MEVSTQCVGFNITEITKKTFNINLSRIHLWMPMITGSACMSKVPYQPPEITTF